MVFNFIQQMFTSFRSSECFVFMIAFAVIRRAATMPPVTRTALEKPRRAINVLRIIGQATPPKDAPLNCITISILDYIWRGKYKQKRQSQSLMPYGVDNVDRLLSEKGEIEAIDRAPYRRLASKRPFQKLRINECQNQRVMKPGSISVDERETAWALTLLAVAYPRSSSSG